MEKVAQHPEHPFRLKLLPQLLGVLGADPSLLSPFFLDVAMPKGPKLHLSRGPVLLPQSKAVLNVSQLCNSHGICCGPFCDCFSVQPLLLASPVSSLPNYRYFREYSPIISYTQMYISTSKTDIYLA